jgi:hypothetical protein
VDHGCGYVCHEGPAKKSGNSPESSILGPRRKHSRRCRSTCSSGKLRHSGGWQTGASAADLCNQVILLSVALTLTLSAASLLSIVRYKALVVVLSDKEISTELLALLALLLQRSKTTIGLLALGRTRALFAGHLHNERATLDGVNKNEARLEVGVHSRHLRGTHRKSRPHTCLRQWDPP